MMTDMPEDIEITPEMIEAGIETMYTYFIYDFDRDEWRSAIREAFSVMRGMEETNRRVAGHRKG